MEGEIPTKRGVQILWEIRPLFNISWSSTIYSLDFIPLEGPSFKLTPLPQWAALNWVPAHFPAPWQIVPDEKTLALHPPPLLPKSGKQKRGHALLVVWVRGRVWGMVDEKQEGKSKGGGKQEHLKVCVCCVLKRQRLRVVPYPRRDVESMYWESQSVPAQDKLLFRVRPWGWAMIRLTHLDSLLPLADREAFQHRWQHLREIPHSHPGSSA